MCSRGGGGGVCHSTRKARSALTLMNGSSFCSCVTMCPLPRMPPTSHPESAKRRHTANSFVFIESYSVVWTPTSSFLDSKILRRPGRWLRRGYRQINLVGKFIVDIKLDAILSG